MKKIQEFFSLPDGEMFKQEQVVVRGTTYYSVIDDDHKDGMRAVSWVRKPRQSKKQPELSSINLFAGYSANEKLKSNSGLGNDK